MLKPYTITIDSPAEELWRFNIRVAGEVLANSERTEFVRFTHDVASVGSRHHEIPADYRPMPHIELHTAAGDALTLYIYYIVHSLPEESSVQHGVQRETDVRVSIKHGDEEVYRHHHAANVWSGCNIEIKL